MVNNKISYAIALFMGLAAFTSCSKDDEARSGNATGNAKLQVRLTDAPGDYEEVNIDIQSVQIHTNQNAGNNDGGWQTLSHINSGVYNLLDFANGHDTLLASASLPAGKISQIRLILGNNNSIKLEDDATVYPLSTPSAQQSGLKLQVHADLEHNVTYVMLLDFDAAKSIVKTGNGNYKLKPVIKVITDAVAGGIQGDIEPNNANPAIFVMQNTDTIAGGFTNSNGQFIIKGLTAGTYTVRFDSAIDSLDKTVTGVVVTNNQITNMGTVTLP